MGNNLIKKRKKSNDDNYLFIEKYTEISKEPNNNPVIPHDNLEELRNTPPEIRHGCQFYKSTKHIIIFNDKEKKINRVYKVYDKYYCPICNELTIPQILFKLDWDNSDVIIKNGGYHYHCRRDILIPCECKNKHLVKLIYSNRCECGWPYVNENVNTYSSYNRYVRD